MTPPATLTASGTSSPASARRTDFATETPAFSCASSVDAPRCGVTMTFGRASSGDSRGGSETNTSRPAPGDALASEGLVQRVLVDEAAAGDVDDEGGRLHLRELLGADHAGGLGGLRHVDRDEVAALEQLVEAHGLHAELLRPCGGDVGVVGDDLGAERLQARGDERADAAEADDADGLLVELDARVVRPLPLALRERGVRGRDVPGEAQDVADGELGRRDDVRGRRVHDHDARGRSRP